MLTKADLQAITGIVKTEIRESENRMTSKLTKKIDGVDKKLDKFVDFLDRDIITLRKRVDRIENELDLSTL